MIQLSAIYCVRDRDAHRIGNCFRSLLAQAGSSLQIEVVLVDYGSSPSFAATYPQLVADFGGHLVKVPRRPDFCKTHALNIGIRKSSASSTFLMTSDIDMVYGPNFLSVLVAELQTPPDALVTCGHWALPADAITPDTDVVEGFEGLCAPDNLTWFRHWSGPCLAARRSWFFQVQGFDEQYLRYGPEDGDLVRRAKRSGLEVRWIHDRVQLLHQWHPTQQEVAIESGPQDAHQHTLCLVKNFARWHTRRTVVRNSPDAWGLLPDADGATAYP